MFLISLLSFASIVASQGEGICGPDLFCLSRLSQYVVIGTVLSNTKNDATSSPTNYSATIAVKCAFLSFSSTGPDRGDNLVGRDINVAMFGGNNKCRSANEADLNVTRIFFIAVQTKSPRPGQPIDYQVVDICVGGIDNSPENLAELGKVMKEYPENLIPTENRGNDPICSSIPTAVETTEPKPADDSSASAMNIFAGLSLMMLAF